MTLPQQGYSGVPTIVIHNEGGDSAIQPERQRHRDERREHDPDNQRQNSSPQ